MCLQPTSPSFYAPMSSELRSREGVRQGRQARGSEVYEVRGLGTAVRCPSCDNTLIRLAHNRGRRWIDLKGISNLQAESVAV
jgi:hypothetical protein